jgi:hypothetical protein
MDMLKVSKRYDTTFSQKAKACIEHPDVDETSKRFISQAVWYVNHDLADERNPAVRIQPVADTLNDRFFYEGVYKGRDSEAVRLLKELGKEAKELLDMCL